MNRFSLVPLGALLILLSGCAANQNRTVIDENHKVTSIFRSGEVNQQYNYFYYGTELEPDAILGIDKTYKVETKLWTPIDLTDKQLKIWIRDLDRVPGDDTFASRYMGRYQGAYVLNPGGKVVGMWYSKVDWGVFEFPQDHTIVPFAPSLRPGSSMHPLRNRDD